MRNDEEWASDLRAQRGGIVNDMKLQLAEKSAEVEMLRQLLKDVLSCWQSRPLMDGDDRGHFNQARLRELYPRLLSAIPYAHR